MRRLLVLGSILAVCVGGLTLAISAGSTDRREAVGKPAQPALRVLPEGLRYVRIRAPASRDHRSVILRRPEPEAVQRGTPIGAFVPPAAEPSEDARFVSIGGSTAGHLIGR